jgi:hypothetical protein
MTMASELNVNMFRTALEKAAATSKMRINSAEMITMMRAKSTLVMAPLSDFDTSPATELPKGVDSVFAYVDSPDRGIPAGFYTLRVTADPTTVGEIDGTVEYVDLRGRVIRKAAAHVDVHSPSSTSRARTWPRTTTRSRRRRSEFRRTSRR